MAKRQPLVWSILTPHEKVRKHAHGAGSLCYAKRKTVSCFVSGKKIKSGVGFAFLESSLKLRAYWTSVDGLISGHHCVLSKFLSTVSLALSVLPKKSTFNEWICSMDVVCLQRVSCNYVLSWCSASFGLSGGIFNFLMRGYTHVSSPAVVL